jgi:hypothetical protein
MTPGMSKPTRNRPRHTPRQSAAADQADQAARGAPRDADEKELDDASRAAVEEAAQEAGPFTPGPATYAPLGGAPMPIDNDPKRQRDL